MIDLAISIDDDPLGVTIVETNRGDHLAAPRWPQDSDFRLVAFNPGANKCEVVSPAELALDIALALEAIKPLVAAAGKKPEWYRQLRKCAAGARNS